ncbi:MAG: ABC transporter ATP-binding protein [Actinomycetota bacterium]|jgi:ATP-binding cassette subfamily B protein
MMFGPPAGGGLGPGGAQTSAAAGLPFAGVPAELAAQADAILATEPEHAEPTVRFDPVNRDRRPFTLRRFLGAHRLALAGAFVLVVFETLALQAGGVLTQQGIDRGITPGNTGVLVAVAMIYVLSVIVATAAGAWRVSWTGRLGERLLYELRLRVFAHLQRLSIDFYTDERAGRLLTRMTSDIDALQQLFQDGLVNLAVQALTVLIVTVILFALEPTLAVITVLVIVPALLALTLWYRSASDRSYAVVRERIADVLADLSETLQGVRIVTAFNRRRQNVVAHRRIVRSYRDANNVTARQGALYGPGADLLGAIAQLAVLLVGGRMVLRGDISIGTLAAFVLYLTAFFAPIQQLVQLYTTYQSGQAAVTKLRDLLATEPAVAERPDAIDLPPLAGRVELDDVHFGYQPGVEVLRGVSLVIEPGETFALVGETGSGKSTIAKLVSRFYDPSHGLVLLDGCDVRDVTIASLRRQLGVVPQEAFLFAASIRDNVAFGADGAADEDVRAACDAVGLGDLVDRLPDGLDTFVHERGVSLSSGERQLLALARALLARPRVLVLDEATSSLDLESESIVERALDAVLEGRTAIVIAHRLATAMRADRIGVIERGELVELGTPQELRDLGGRYAEMEATWRRHANA